MAVNAIEERLDAHSVTVLPDGSITNPQCESLSEFPSLLEVRNVTKNQMCSDSLSNGLKHPRTKMEDMEGYAPPVVDIDIEKGKLETPKSGDGAVGNMKSDDFFARAQQRAISFQIGGKFMQLLMNHNLEVPKVTSRDKCIGERVYDTSTNRSRKYKRSASFNASFNSRRVVLLFSVLSIMGTMTLIYLTLRVRQLNYAVVNA